MTGICVCVCVVMIQASWAAEFGVLLRFPLKLEAMTD